MASQLIKTFNSVKNKIKWFDDKLDQESLVAASAHAFALQIKPQQLLVGPKLLFFFSIL